MNDLTRGNPLSVICKFALPIFFGNLFQIFYSLADTRIVGSFLGDDAIAAVGATSSLNNMIIGFLLGLTNGFALMTARFFGAGDKERIKKAVGNSLRIALIFAIVMTLISVVFYRQILLALSTPESIMASSGSYFRIIMLGMIFSMLYNWSASIMRAIGDSLRPLIFLIAASVINVGLDLLFVGPLKMGVRGAALATIMSQCISFAASTAYMWKNYKILNFGIEDMKRDRSLSKELLSTGLSMGFMGTFVNIGSVFLQWAINLLGNELYIVAQTAARKLTEIFMLPFGVFGASMATYCSQNYGAKKPERITKGVWSCIFITLVWCTAMLLLALFASPALVRLVTDTSDPKVIYYASLYLKVDTILYFVCTYVCIVRNALQGMGDSVTPIVSSFLELITKVVVAVFFSGVFGYWAIIMAEPVAWVLMVVPLLIRSLKSPINPFYMKKMDAAKSGE